MLLAFVPVILVGLVLLVAVGVASLWAECGGKRPPTREDSEDPEESDPSNGGGGAARRQDSHEDAEAPAGDDERPWEQPGAFRLDCEPDRGTTLLWLGRLSLWLIAGAALVGAAALLPVLPLAIAVLVMASRDRAKMRAGTMDPAGEWPTRKGARYAKAALVVLVLFILAFGGLVAAMIAYTDS
jgi:hypothetical protein